MRRSKFFQLILLVVALGLIGGAAKLIKTYWADAMTDPATAQPELPVTFRTAPGFKVELLYSASKDEGTWITMAFDPQGRIVLGNHIKAELERLTFSGSHVTSQETLDIPIAEAMGLGFHNGYLYIVGLGPQGRGLYRAANKEHGIPGPLEFLRPLRTGSGFIEHGAHGMAFAPNGKMFLVCGDHTQLPTDLQPSSPARSKPVPPLFAIEPDPLGWGLEADPASGFVLQMNDDGTDCELFATGMRNIYQIDFNEDGELFGFDNDAERDLGLPWYRPTRFTHIVPGGEYGFRQGDGPVLDCEDVLPAARNVGLGAPTVVRFVPPTAHMPANLKGACVVGDWANGRLSALHLIPRGATYQATIETLVSGEPLNVTSLEFGPDGSAYFIVGGRSAPAGLYRLSWENKTDPPSLLAVSPSQSSNAFHAREQRRQLESFQMRPDSADLNAIWRGLASPDHWIRYAARTALEFQPPEKWQASGTPGTDTLISLEMLLAEARGDEAPLAHDFLKRVAHFSFASLTSEENSVKWRAAEIGLARGAQLDANDTNAVCDEVEREFAGADSLLRRRLFGIMCALHSRGVISAGLAQMHSNQEPTEQLFYAAELRHVTNGWTLDQHRQYFTWFNALSNSFQLDANAGVHFQAAHSNAHTGEVFDQYVDTFRQAVWDAMSATEQKALSVYQRSSPHPFSLAASTGKNLKKKSVKEWKLADFTAHPKELTNPHSVARGYSAFRSCGCLNCHHFGLEGYSFGPDLTDVGKRMQPVEILESILQPSKYVAEQYQNTVLVLHDGDVVSGRLTGEDEKCVHLLTSGFNPLRVPKQEIISRHLSAVSPMPEGLVNGLDHEDILSLIKLLRRGIINNAQPPSN